MLNTSVQSSTFISESTYLYALTAAALVLNHSGLLCIHYGIQHTWHVIKYCSARVLQAALSTQPPTSHKHDSFMQHLLRVWCIAIATHCCQYQHNSTLQAHSVVFSFPYMHMCIMGHVSSVMSSRQSNLGKTLAPLLIIYYMFIIIDNVFIIMFIIVKVTQPSQKGLMGCC